MPTPLYEATDCHPPYEMVPVERSATGDQCLPELFRQQVLIHTPHDGDKIPPAFLFRKDGRSRVDEKRLARLFIKERDWGANLVARRIASAMGISCYARCRVARVLLDFNRFPGSTPPGQDEHLERLCINEPFSSELGHAEKMRLLEDYYDSCSAFFEQSLLGGKLIMIAVHTYDEHNRARTRRAQVSLLSAMANYSRESRMPFGVFDPLFPDVLGASTCSPILRDRLALNLERTGFRVHHNHPYPLPEGSLEVRAQVWKFFEFLKERFEQAHRYAVGDEAYALVWKMLFNTNLRLGEAEALRSYLHRFRKVNKKKRARFHDAHLAYVEIGKFLVKADIVREFRVNKNRPSAIGIEVRKDLVCSWDDDGIPLPVTNEQQDRAALLGNVIASAINTYFETDRSYL